MIGDYFRFAVSGIGNKGVRSWLTMAGIFLGIATVVALISLGQGMKDAISEQFQMLGPDVILVMPGQGLGAPTASKLTEHDVKLIEEVGGVDMVAAMVTKLSQVMYRDNTAYTFIGGIPTDKSMKIIEDMQAIKIHEGRKFFPTDNYKAIVGYSIATKDTLLGHMVKVGDRLTINGYDFTVIGSLESVGNQQDDTNIYIPLDTSEEIFNTKDYITLMVKVKTGQSPSEVSDAIKKKLRRDRGEKEGEEDFSVQTQEQMMESFNIILNVVQAVLVGIAFISLLVGGIGIMNTMYTSVLERTSEIGIMKAIGARNSDILLLFLVESGVLGMVGGIVGVLIGLGISKSVEYVAVASGNAGVISANTSPFLILGALAFSFIVGCISGVLPAMQASKLKPVDALRYE